MNSTSIALLTKVPIPKKQQLHTKNKKNENNVSYFRKFA